MDYYDDVLHAYEQRINKAYMEEEKMNSYIADNLTDRVLSICMESGYWEECAVVDSLTLDHDNVDIYFQQALHSLSTGDVDDINIAYANLGRAVFDAVSARLETMAETELEAEYMRKQL